MDDFVIHFDECLGSIHSSHYSIVLHIALCYLTFHLIGKTKGAGTGGQQSGPPTTRAF